ncbi:MAG: hypothetical protein FWG39_02885 [Alphaproteobacteria bacterium]|nr:hypothetical protein [Alphaproteobacteria bacterium]
MQAGLFSAVLYEPWAHSVQAPFARKLPAGHAGQLVLFGTVAVGHGVQVALPVPLAYVPTAQSVHPVLPVPVAYVPAGHSVHDVTELLSFDW